MSHSIHITRAVTRGEQRDMISEVQNPHEQSNIHSSMGSGVDPSRDSQENRSEFRDEALSSCISVGESSHRESGLQPQSEHIRVFPFQRLQVTRPDSREGSGIVQLYIGWRPLGTRTGP